MTSLADLRDQVFTPIGAPTGLDTGGFFVGAMGVRLPVEFLKAPGPISPGGKTVLLAIGQYKLPTPTSGFDKQIIRSCLDKGNCDMVSPVPITGPDGATYTQVSFTGSGGALTLSAISTNCWAVLYSAGTVSFTP